LGGVSALCDNVRVLQKIQRVVAGVVLTRLYGALLTVIRIEKGNHSQIFGDERFQS
jgi:hypothetical protein